MKPARTSIPLAQHTAGVRASATRTLGRRARCWTRWGVFLAVTVAIAFLSAPVLAGVPAKLVKGCGAWIAAAFGFELLSVLGFVVFFKLVFAGPVSWRRSVPAGLRALAASTLVPAGGLVGPSMGAWSATEERPSLGRLARATVVFALLTSAPAAFALAALGVLTWLGLLGGPRDAALTLLPAALAGAVIVATLLAARRSLRVGVSRPRARRSCALARVTRPLQAGLTDALELAVAGDLKLAGALAYSAFDLAVLWAAFHAYAHTPQLGVIAMGYLIGSLAGALPLPAGLGVVDGGLIGALVLYGAPVAPAAGAVLLYRGISLSLPIALGAVGWMSCPRPRSLARGVRPVLGRATGGRGAASDLVTVAAES